MVVPAGFESKVVEPSNEYPDRCPTSPRVKGRPGFDARFCGSDETRKTTFMELYLCADSVISCRRGYSSLPIKW
jgi:hypothetical protein